MSSQIIFEIEGGISSIRIVSLLARDNPSLAELCAHFVVFFMYKLNRPVSMMLSHDFDVLYDSPVRINNGSVKWNKHLELNVIGVEPRK